MKITQAEWNDYINKLSLLSDKASEEFKKWANKNGGWENIDRQLILDAGYSFATKYAEGSSALAAAMYDAIAEAENKRVPSAEMADEIEFGTIAKAINGAMKHSTNDDFISSTVGRAVKQSGADTMLKNASRDGAEFAWIPSGETCPFCLVLASRGWQKASKKTTNGNHAEHIHTNCNCQFAIRFNKNTNVEGYDPDVYQKMYYDAPGVNSKEKINNLRRAIESKLYDNDGLLKTDDQRNNEDKKSIIKPSNIRKDLTQTETGRNALDLIEKNNTKVSLTYGVDNTDYLGRPMLGYYDPDENQIVVFADKTKTVKDTARVIVHEAYHIDDFGACQKSEVYCTIMEYKHDSRKEKLTHNELMNILKTIKEAYFDLPWR